MECELYELVKDLDCRVVGLFRGHNTFPSLVAPRADAVNDRLPLAFALDAAVAAETRSTET